MPVIYLLDGGAHFLHTVATMDLLSRRDKMPYSLVVGIENPDRGRDLTAVAVPGRPSGGADHFLDFIESELIPFVEKSFPAAPHRTLIGHSLGASFVLHALVERPDLFDAAIAISPAITNDERTGEGQASFSKRMGAAFADRESQLFSLFVTMSDGEELEWETDLVAITDLLERDAPEDSSGCIRECWVKITAPPSTAAHSTVCGSSIVIGPNSWMSAPERWTN